MFKSRMNIQGVVLRHSKLLKYMRIVATRERKSKTRQNGTWTSAKICTNFLDGTFRHKNLL